MFKKKLILLLQWMLLRGAEIPRMKQNLRYSSYHCNHLIEGALTLYPFFARLSESVIRHAAVPFQALNLWIYWSYSSHNIQNDAKSENFETKGSNKKGNGAMTHQLPKKSLRCLRDTSPSLHENDSQSRCLIRDINAASVQHSNSTCL